MVFEGFGNGLLVHEPTEGDPPGVDGWYEEMASPGSPVQFAIPRELRPDDDFWTPDYKRQWFLWNKQQEFQRQKAKVKRWLNFETVATDVARLDLKELKIKTRTEPLDLGSKVQSESGSSKDK